MNNLRFTIYDLRFLFKKSFITFSLLLSTFYSFSQIEKGDKLFIEQQYDEAIKNTLDNNFSNSKVIRSKEFWIFEYEGIKCYRTLHPLSYQYKNKNAKHDYYQDIVDDINNGFALFE